MDAHARPPRSSEPSATEAGFDALLGEMTRFEDLIAQWEESQRSVALAYRRTLDALHKTALRNLIAGVKEAPGALDALKKSAADPFVYAVLRYHGLVRPSQQERIEQALASVRPTLAAHGGDVELVAFLPPDTVEVRFLGNCDGCAASTLTFVAGVERAIAEHCPEIVNVRRVKGKAGAPVHDAFTSPFAAAEGGRWFFAAPLDAIPDGGVLDATIESEAVILARSGNAVRCYRDACAHLGLPISTGAVANGRIVCPRHGFQYDLMTGECLTAPEVQLQPLPARLVDGRVEIRLEA